MPPPSKPAQEPPKNTDRNEYIPSFISKKPFYIDDETASQDDYLLHQRLQSQKNSDPIATSAWYERGKKAAPAATKYRKGACENCGAMTHKARDCLQRTRKHGARWTGRDIQADEAVQDVKLGWDAKRDRWNGYDPSEYQAVVDEYNAVEEMKRKAAADGEEEEEEEGAKYDEETDMGRKQATSTRNLRLREDTAKYLLDLDLESAKYDPKTRTMAVDESDPASLDADAGFARPDDGAAAFERAQRYAWENAERTGAAEGHLQANPTAGEVARRKELAEKKEKSAAAKAALLAKYGGEEHSLPTAKPLAAVTENEAFVEYDAKGRLKSLAAKKEKSMYAEDVKVNNHTAVWGSWWKDFKWGYACCHSMLRNSYCVGEEGKQEAKAITANGEEAVANTAKRSLEDSDEAEQRKRHAPDGEEG